MTDLSPRNENPLRAVDPLATLSAGVAAGVVSTVAQVALWALFTDALPAILFRDARLAAAIVLGTDVLPPPASFDVDVMLVATVVHFALSLAYALLVAALVAPRRKAAALAIGAAFGVVLFVVNMYGFTAVFPWFAAARDWITLAAHVVFGVTAAGVYKAVTARGAEETPT